MEDFESYLEARFVAELCASIQGELCDVLRH